MFALEVRDHVMIAHSLPGEAFGPAQRMHGATFVIDVAFYRESLTENDIVVDIGLAAEALQRVIAPINYRNLDEIDAFSGRRSTTEVLAHYIFMQMKAEIFANRLGSDAREISRLRVTLSESHVARAWYEASLVDA
ncbi:MAG: 6-carboxytetrahydropterin synthase [Rhodobacteraceae bacterium]|nr:6-carboxytetrahydropterin synthase [Paracoccaceae bacterium]